MADDKQTEVQPSVQATENRAGLRDKRTLPEGVAPKQAQGYVVAGLAVLILMAVMFSKSRAKPAAKEAPASPLAMSTDMNQRKIKELERNLSADQQEAQRQSQQQTEAQKAATANLSVGSGGAEPAGAAASVAPLPPPTEKPRDPVADAERELAFKARFASNLISGGDTQSHEPSSIDAILHAGENVASGHAPSMPSAISVAGTKRPPEVSVNSAQGQPYVVFEGTTVDAALVNRLDGEFSGPVKVMVTNPVYSQDRQHVLIPEGTFLLGEAQKVAGFGQKRLAVTFHRMLMPDGYSVDLDQFHGLDQAGETGLKDKVDNHYVQMFGASIALGIISGAAQVTNSSAGFNQSGTEAYKSGVASNLSQSGTNMLDKFINIPPTITIREGHRIKVYITQDMLLPAVENHTVPGNI